MMSKKQIDRMHEIASDDEKKKAKTEIRVSNLVTPYNYTFKMFINFKIKIKIIFIGCAYA